MDNEIDLLRKYRIGVLAGGNSAEREVSLKSGRAVFNALQGRGLDAVFIDAGEHDFSLLIDHAGISAAFIALHGRFGEDGTVQRILERMGIPYTGSDPESSALALDKLASKKKFEDKGLRVPEYRIVRRGDDVLNLDICFPCVIKPRCEGSSIGLFIVPSREHMREAAHRAVVFSEEIIVERFVPGREITVGVLGTRPLPVVEIIAADGIYDFNAKYHSADTRYVVPAELDEADYRRVQETGLMAHKALGCRGFSRVDLRLSEEGEIFILEVNTIPGLTERSLFPMAAKAAGLDFSELCIKMLYGALAERH